VRGRGSRPPFAGRPTAEICERKANGRAGTHPACERATVVLDRQPRWSPVCGWRCFLECGRCLNLPPQAACAVARLLPCRLCSPRSWRITSARRAAQCGTSTGVRTRKVAPTPRVVRCADEAIARRTTRSCDLVRTGFPSCGFCRLVVRFPLGLFKRPLVAARRLAADPRASLGALHLGRTLADWAAGHRHHRRQIATFTPAVATASAVHRLRRWNAVHSDRSTHRHRPAQTASAHADAVNLRTV